MVGGRCPSNTRETNIGHIPKTQLHGDDRIGFTAVDGRKGEVNARLAGIQRKCESLIVSEAGIDSSSTSSLAQQICPQTRESTERRKAPANANIAIETGIDSGFGFRCPLTLTSLKARSSPH